VHAIARVLHRFTRDENGASAVEYALVAGIMSLALLPAIANTSTGIAALFGQIPGLFALV